MAKGNIDEAKGKWVPDRPMKVHVANMEKRDTADLKGMHDRWSGDHKDKKSDPSTSERLLAVHHVLKKRGESVPELPQHRNLGRMSYVNEESSGTEARVKIKNVARLGDADPTSEKSKLSKTGEIKTKSVDEDIAASISRKYGLSGGLLEAAKAVMERKTEIIQDPEINDKLDNGDDDDVKKESKHTTPKSHKDKKLAALAHPKDKITHKDVLVGRGVLKKEETEIDIDSLTEEQLEEVLKKSDLAGKWISDFVHSKDPKFEGKSKKERMKQALGAYYAKQRNEEIEQIDELKKSTLASYTKKAVGDVAKRSDTLGKNLHLALDPNHMDTYGKYYKKTEKRKGMINKAVDKLAKEEVELTAEELERIESIAAQLDEVSAVPAGDPSADQSGVGTKKSSTKTTLSDEKKMRKEEVELEEGRGRPKKSGGEAEGDDTHKHPIQQLTKIAHAIEGSEPHFEHKDGAKTKVGKHLAKHVMAVYGSMRTSQEKDDFANKLHASKDSMKSAVSKLF